MIQISSGYPEYTLQCGYCLSVLAKSQIFNDSPNGGWNHDLATGKEESQLITIYLKEEFVIDGLFDVLNSWELDVFIRDIELLAADGQLCLLSDSNSNSNILTDNYLVLLFSPNQSITYACLSQAQKVSIGLLSPFYPSLLLSQL